MRNISFSLIAITLALLTQALRAQSSPSATSAQPVPNYILWRSTADVGDLDYISCPKCIIPTGPGGAPVPDTFTLVPLASPGQTSPGQAAPLVAQPLPCNRSWDDNQDFFIFSTAGLSPGAYIIQPGSLALTIRAAPSTQPIAIELPPPSHTLDYRQAIQNCFSADQSAILPPGDWGITGDIDVEHDHLSLVGSGEGATTLHIRKSNAYGNRAFYTNGGAYKFALRNLKVVTDVPGAILVHSNAPFTNLELTNVETDNCTVLQCVAPGAHVLDCLLKRPNTFIGDHECYERDEFAGIGRFGNEVICTGIGPMVFDCNWRDTGRGMTFRSGPIAGNFTGITIEGLCHIPNGDENFNVEDTAIANPIGLQSCVFSHVTVRGSDGAVVEFWHTPAGRNTFKHFKLFQAGRATFLTGEPNQNSNCFSDWTGTASVAPTTQPGQTYTNFFAAAMNNQ